MFNVANLNDSKTAIYYVGVINGSAPLGAIINMGHASQTPPPKVAIEPNRRSLNETEWIQEYFNASTALVSQGLNNVDSTQPIGFACHSFLSKSNVSLKVIVLDKTQSDPDGSTDIHGHGHLDAYHWALLQAELDEGQADNHHMSIAAHKPIGVLGFGSETEWRSGCKISANPVGYACTTAQHAVNLTGLGQKLQATANLLMSVAGVQHLSTVKPFVSTDPVNAPGKDLRQAETLNLRDFPQQFRKFEIYLNSGYTISIITTIVDPEFADGMPAAASRNYAFATQQKVQTNRTVNNSDNQTTYGTPFCPMDPTRPLGDDPISPQSGDPNTATSIRYVAKHRDRRNTVSGRLSDFDSDSLLH